MAYLGAWLVVEIYYQANIDQVMTDGFLIEVAMLLDLRIYVKPIAHVTGGVGDSKGFDDFVSLCQS
jgi:hypothetical protein